MSIHFHRKPGLVVYLTAGDPNLSTTRDIALAAIDNGADVIELGVPFSDPLADGPVIQRASERAVAKGTRLSDVLGLAKELRAARPSCGLVLFSYLNPVHELRVKQLVEQELPGVFVTTSSEVSPQFREFERFTTTCMNAFLGPKVKTFMSSLSSSLHEAGIRGEVHVMTSNGGIATTQTISEKPVYSLLSGLAAGVLGGHWVGKQTNRQNLITFDVGGTSADIGIITRNGYSEASSRNTMIAGFPVMVPMIDVHTIGAGGGSIAHVDAGNAFRVGPRSAGSAPIFRGLSGFAEVFRCDPGAPAGTQFARDQRNHP